MELKKYPMGETMNLEKGLQQIYVDQIPEREYQYLKDALKNEREILLCRTDAKLENPLYEKNTLLISGNADTLKTAAERGMATIGYQNPGNRDDEAPLLQADMIVEGFEEVDIHFLENVYKRHCQIPWTILETKRCIVRELELSDLDALFELYEQPGMTDYMEGLYPYEQEKEYQSAYIQNMYGFYGYGMWLVFEKETGKLIGRAGVEHREELEGELELGYAIGREFQRQGYATEVCEAILSYVKEELAFTTVVCLIEPENTTSIAFARKLGFHFEREKKIEGKTMRLYRILF